jgi:Amino-transferase class IV
MVLNIDSALAPQRQRTVRFVLWTTLFYFSCFGRLVDAFSIQRIPVKSETVRQELAETSSAMPANSWCCTASWDPSTKKPLIQPVSRGKGIDSDLVKSLGVSILDLTTAPDWMEWIESVEARGLDEGGAGAYDTMRCDLIVATSTNGDEEPRHSCWGEDYHLDRLQNSYVSLLDASARNSLPQHALKSAREESRLLLQALIHEAKSSSEMIKQTDFMPHDNAQDHTWIQILKLTLLWSLPKTKDQQEEMPFIIVRGHACSDGKIVPIFEPVQPIVVTTAILDSQSHQGHSSLPTRFQNPQSKVASWCKQRKLMDNAETYKPPGVSEVLMVRTSNEEPIGDGEIQYSSLELMEGLTSNLFVVYNDGTLRTAQEGVLFGYVRHLVLESAARCHVQVDVSRAITLQDAVDGKWSEVFITSSSRLIYPISRILLPLRDGIPLSKSDDNDLEGFVEFWRDPVLTETGMLDASPAIPKWQALLDEILRVAGYER